MTNSIEGVPSVKMRCVERKPKRRGRPPKRLPDETVEQLAELLPDEALAEAVRGLDAGESHLSGRADTSSSPDRGGRSARR